jgi:hypothetical protein
MALLLFDGQWSSCLCRPGATPYGPPYLAWPMWRLFAGSKLIQLLKPMTALSTGLHARIAKPPRTSASDSLCQRRDGIGSTLRIFSKILQSWFPAMCSRTTYGVELSSTQGANLGRFSIASSCRRRQRRLSAAAWLYVHRSVDGFRRRVRRCRSTRHPSDPSYPCGRCRARTRDDRGQDQGCLLQAAKARGIRVGRNGADRLAPAHRAEAIERAQRLAPILAEMKGAGMSARQMAAELAARGIATQSGGRWHAQSVLRMIERAAR